MLKTMPADRLSALRASARRSVQQSGAVNLAEYVLKVYNTALHKKRRSRLMVTPAFRVHLRKQNKGD